MAKKAKAPIDEKADRLQRLKESRRKLENRFCVRISSAAFEFAVHGLETFHPQLISDEASPWKPIEILARACKLVVERFKNCAYERDFYENAYRLRWALVEIVELFNKTDWYSKSWVDRLRWDRDSASILMGEFLSRWEVVLESPPRGFGVLFSDFAKNIKILRKNAYSHLSSRRIAKLLDVIQDGLIYSFERHLTVSQVDVAQVVSTLTDVPPTVILPSIDHQKEAIYMTCRGLLEQNNTIHEIYATLVSTRRGSNNLPRGSFLLLGSTGTGKTDIARAVAEYWYCDASRLVEIDLSDYDAEETAECSTEKHEDFWGRLTGVVARRPYSVIVIDNIEKASPSVMRVLLELLRGEAQASDVVDFSNSVIFMTSGVGSDQLDLRCVCHKRNEDLWNQFLSNQYIFRKTHDCILKGSGPERALAAAKKLLGTDLLDSVDKVFILKRFTNYRSVLRVLLRKIVSQLFGDKRLIVHASNEVLNFLFLEALQKFGKGGKALEKVLHEHIVPWLTAVDDLKTDVVVRVDKFAGARELLFSFQEQETCVDDWYFKFKDGTFDKAVGNVRMKVESMHRIFKSINEYKRLLQCRNGTRDSGRLVVDICDEILRWSPFPERQPFHNLYLNL
ncbi:chaperone ClpB [Striga asiatica]|uniref:Chaperone ClpB n=1 Tax=Striga asiatica TaxID=4170 RepID=A0A5A7RHD7_STRAF|nr:chaperone ClpB [Striga asiatica]